MLCKKWIIIREDIGEYKTRHFNRLLESIPGITPRILSMRLNELEKKGSDERVKQKHLLLYYFGGLLTRVKICYLF
ncbi:MAG TPA: winged helix-turn-helix transcriptional regulator [Nitrososphaeraceae archaeon]